MVCFVVAAAGLVVGAGEGSERAAFRYLGQVKARPASEVGASNWSVGAETMDRD